MPFADRHTRHIFGLEKALSTRLERVSGLLLPVVERGSSDVDLVVSDLLAMGACSHFSWTALVRRSVGHVGFGVGGCLFRSLDRSARRATGPRSFTTSTTSASWSRDSIARAMPSASTPSYNSSPMNPALRARARHASHSSARQADSSHGGAWSLWRRERLPAFVLGALSVSRRLSRKVVRQPPGPTFATARRRDAANRPRSWPGQTQGPQSE
jgi:hypothetical protein